MDPDRGSGESVKGKEYEWMGYCPGDCGAGGIAGRSNGTGTEAQFLDDKAEHYS